VRIARPRGMTTPAQSLPVPLASSATWRIPSPGVERYRPLARVPLYSAIGQATVTGAGAATVTVGPTGVGTRWYPVKADITTTSGTTDASTCALYVGVISLATQIGGTSYAGGGDTFGLAGHMLQPGDFLIAVWAGGKPGDTATLRITGDQVAMVN